MTFVFCKKDLKEKLEMLRKEENEDVSADKAVGKALVVLASASCISRSPHLVIATKPLALRPGESTIF